MMEERSTMTVDGNEAVAIGAMLYSGDNESEFGSIDGKAYYLHIKATF